MARQRNAVEPIAVVGMAVRVPGASTPARLWRNILEARDCLARPSLDELQRTGVSRKRLADPHFVRARPLLEDIEYFDAAFFDISSFEAERTDPAHRLFLACVWEALESAAIVPGGEGPVTGVFGGVEGLYRKKNLAHLDDGPPDPVVDLPLRLGTSLDFFTARVSHKLDLAGPSFAVMAACATSLLAVHLAVQSLRRRECEVAVAGGSSVDLPQEAGYLAGVEGMLSPTGRIRPFDAAADGTVFGNGVGVVVLRPLADALAEGNPIHGVIRSSATTNDGNPAGKESFIAPSAPGQRAAIAGALAEAGIDAATIGYLEAHGTGTLLGDPTEVTALSDVYRSYTNAPAYCALGSVKANVGHLRTAAGVVSLIKACLALEHGIVPPAANFQSPNPMIEFARSPFFINTEPRTWVRAAHPRRAGVSAFGFGGSNVHVILEEPAGKPMNVGSARRSHLFIASARSESALTRRLTDLGAHLEANPLLEPADVAHTLQTGRTAMSHRTCVYVDETFTPAKLLERTQAAAVVPESGTRPLIYLFPGQGSQRPRMGTRLYATEAIYRESVDRSAALLEPELGFDIRTLIHGTGDDADAYHLLRETGNAQPALFVVEYALAELFLSWGAEPAAMLGHSIGELVAACVAKVFSLRDALRIVAARGRLMQRCNPGAMAAVFMPSEELAASLPPKIEIAAVNAPAVSVVSGPLEAVAAFTGELSRKGVATHHLETSHAFHSWMMEPVLPQLSAVLGEVELRPPVVPVISNATGSPLTAEQATDAGYWAAQVRRPVYFTRGLQSLLAHDNPVFVELGPGRALTDLVRRHSPDAPAGTTLDTDPGTDEPQNVLLALGRIWSEGAEVRWEKFYGGEPRRKVVLPTYPFQRLRYWLEPPDRERSQTGQIAFYETGWRKTAIEPATQAARPWMIFRDELGLADEVASGLKNDGRRVVLLSAGPEFSQTGASSFSIRPGSRNDLKEVLAFVAGPDGIAPQVLHLWSLTGPSGLHNSVTAFQQGAARGFHTLLALVQAAWDQGCCAGLNVLVAADGLAQLDGEGGALHAEKAALLGPCRDIPTEIADLSMRCVDIPAITADGAAPWLTGALTEETAQRDDHLLVALRGDGRYVQEIYALPELPLGHIRLREGGVVLITGGTGGLGLTIAAGLFDWARARIALTSRWEPPPRDTWPERASQPDKVGSALKSVMALEARGAEVLIVRADTADVRSLAAGVSQVQSHFGTINAVVHAAGIAEPTPALRKQQESSKRVFASKVHGAFYLEEILRGVPLDFLVHFSSIASHYPEPGQVDYSAANAVLDALARQRAKEQRGLSCAIGWGPWQDVGMAAARWNATPAHPVSPGQQLLAERALPGRTVPFDHPILETRQELEPGRFSYSGVLRQGKQWVVDEHRFLGQPLLSGTTITECVRASFADHTEKLGCVELTQIAFQRPVFVLENGTEIEIRFTPDDSAERFELYSRPAGSEGPWLLNTSGLAANSTREPTAPVTRPPLDLSGHFPLERGEFLSDGPRFRCLEAVKAYGDATWSKIRLAEEFLEDMRDYVLHPGLLDLGCGINTRRFHVEAVPYTIDGVFVFAPPGPEFFVHGRRRSIGGSNIFEIELVNGDGEILVEIHGYAMREIRDSSLPRWLGERTRTASSETRSSGAQHAVVAQPGDLASIRLEKYTPRPPGAGEIQIEVVAAGLNFRDLLAALGELPDELRAAPPLGSELSGVICAVGPDVTAFRPGDAVVALATHAIATHVTTHADLAVPIPRGMGFEAAAGLPIVFLTAHYALNELAMLQRGERVLIHAASGGVGLAAVQLAQETGAEIFATAGRPEKRNYLKERGIDHVMDSRSLDFTEEILRATNGEGVDVVLNSLAGPFIEASLSVLRPYGRFIEIGKRDIYANTRLGLYPFRNNLSYHALDLGKMIGERRPALLELFDTLMDRFARRELKSTPVSIIPFATPDKGFERMARAEHIGKIVFRVRADADPERAAAQRFHDTFGEGISVADGLQAFRHLLSSDETPPGVLALDNSMGVSSFKARSNFVARGRGREIGTPYRPPESAIEKTLTGIWEKTLGLSQIGIDDHFFELGGDSITAIQIRYSVVQAFNVRLPTALLFSELTVSSLAQTIGLLQGTNAGPEEIEALLAQVEGATEDEVARELAKLEQENGSGTPIDGSQPQRR